MLIFIMCACVTDARRIIPLLTSWLSLALTVAAFNRAQRNSRQAALNENGMRFAKEESYASLRHQMSEMAWRLFETGGRVVAIALFTSVFSWWILAVLVPHAFVMLA
jgi:hypothetical protein